MKILLIGLNARYSHISLGVYAISRFLKSKNVENEICEYTINDSYENVLFDIVSKKPDIIGFSTYIWNIKLAERLADDIKIAFKNVKIVFGGPEAGYSTTSYKNVDKVITGEGESQFYEYVTNLKTTFNFNEMPFYYDEIPKVGKTVYYESSRGCPYRCSYCISSLEKNLVFKDIVTVKNDIDYFIKNKIKKVKFIDRTFNARKDYKEIWQYIIENSADTSFHFEIKPELFKSEDFKLLSKAKNGLMQFEIGLQSLNENTLNAINRKNDTELIIKNITALLKENNIHIHLDLIAGLPLENLESFKNGFNSIFKLRTHVLQLGFLKVLNGTQIKNDVEKYGIEYSSYPPYSVLKTDCLSVFDIMELKYVENGLETFWNKGFFKNAFLFLLDNNHIDVYNFFKQCGMILKKSPPLSHPDLFSLFYKIYIKNDYYDKNSFLNSLICDFKEKNPTKPLFKF